MMIRRLFHPRPTRPLGLCLGVLLFFPLACRHQSDPDPQLFAVWTRVMYGAMRVERLSPPIASRLTAYAASAMYGGVAAVHPRLTPLTTILHGLPPMPRVTDASAYDATVVAVAAQRTVLDTLMQEALPTTRTALASLADSLTNARRDAGVSIDVLSRSDSLGREVGLRIVAWSRSDGFAETRALAYVPPDGEGLWRNDSTASTYTTQNLSGASEFVELNNPSNQQRAGNVSDRGLILSRPKRDGERTLPSVNMAGATEPYWRQLRPFVLASWDACPIAAVPAYGADSLAPLWADARAVVEARRSLTDEQKTIAYYWADNAGETGTPVGHWLSIAGQTISERRLSGDEAVQLIFATAIAQADAFVAAFGYKYSLNLLRPRTYIRRFLDSTWEPLIPTPPFPEFPSAHSTQSAAAARTLTALVGALPFTDSTSVSIGHAVRQFASFEAASEEAGMSRVYGGIHFPAGNTSGLALGRCVGDRVVAAVQGTSMSVDTARRAR